MNNGEQFFNTSGGGGYAIERSLRFNSADSSFLSRTPASAGNRKTWTWAGWVKRSALGAYQYIWGNANSSAENGFMLRFENTDTIRIADWTNAAVWQKITTQVFRDVSAWYHIVISYDTTNATAADRVRFYVNGSRVSAFSTSTDPTQDYDGYTNNTSATSIGRWGAQDAYYFSGYLADIHFIDGQALDPTSFGEFDANGIWQPIAYSGSYGTNGFHLDFADNSTAAALGYDAAGSNDWTVNNLSVTAGAGNDSLIDVPTNGTETDTGVGNEVRGNYCTWNPLAKTSTNRTVTNGNLETTGDNNDFLSVLATIAMPTGKWYWECTVGTLSTYNQTLIGISQQLPSAANIDYGYYSDSGQKRQGGTSSSYGASFTAGDIIGVAFDADNGSLTFYKNNTSQGVAFSSIPTGNYLPCITGAGATPYIANFGQRPFAYTAPSGFKALNTSSLPAPTIEDPSTVMDVALYTGNGSTQTISGLGFSPDLVWIKERSISGYWHELYDTVRTAGKRLFSNATDAENTTTNLSAFTSDGFTLGSSDPGVNGSSQPYVAWCWDAGTSNATNTSGTITSTVRANISAGFSIVSYTGNQTAGQTIGHGLGVTPSLIIVKNRDTATFGWATRFGSFSSTEYLELNTTAAIATNTNIWDSTLPTSSVFSVGESTRTNASGDDYIAYCFAPVEGYSAFGSYTGNGNSGSPPFVHTGFSPKFVLIKNYYQGNTNWVLHDTVRQSYNTQGPQLKPNSSAAEYTAESTLMDIFSNGFSPKRTVIDYNANGNTYIYAAFAENSFALNARAR